MTSYFSSNFALLFGFDLSELLHGWITWALLKAVLCAFTHSHRAFRTHTHTYFHTSAYLSSCSKSRGSSRFEHKLRYKTSKFEPFADGLQPSTCIELLCTAQTDEAAVMSHWVCFSLYDYKNINHNTWPHGKCYFSIVIPEWGSFRKELREKLQQRIFSCISMWCLCLLMFP